MNKTLVVIFLLVLTSSQTAFSQKYRTVELKPITQQGWSYFYDMNKVSSPLALEVPLLAVKDNEVNRYLRASKNWRTAESFVTLIPLIYILSLPRNQYVDPNTFWWIFGGTLAVQLGMEAITHFKLGKAIDKYNMIILQPSGHSLGLQLTWRFL